jgi:hypothetical protein
MRHSPEVPPEHALTTFIKMLSGNMTGGNLRTVFAVSGAALFFMAAFVIVSPGAYASDVQTPFNLPEFSFSDLLAEWGRALTDPAVYTTWMHIDGFFGFLGTETFLSVFGGNAYVSAGGAGAIPNVFFVVCIITSVLCVAIGIVGIKRAESAKRTIRK